MLLSILPNFKKVSSHHKLISRLLSTHMFSLPLGNNFVTRKYRSGKDSNSPIKTKIYTRTGDKGVKLLLLKGLLIKVGTTLLFSGQRVPKDDSRVACLGNNDELTCSIGVAIEFCRQHEELGESVQQLLFIQQRLQELNSHVATVFSPSLTPSFDMEKKFTTQLEEWIDVMNEQLPALKNFILPSGGLASSHLHMARSICRRAERQLYTLVQEQKVSENAGRFLNRLSDYLFMAARYACFRTDNQEVSYKAN